MGNPNAHTIVEGDSVSSILSTLSAEVKQHLPAPQFPIIPLHINSAKEILHTTLQPHGIPLGDVTNHLLKDITPNLNQTSLSPHYYGFVTGGATHGALTADIIASIYDQNVQVHLPKETISTTLEAAALNMLLDLFYLPRPEWGIGLPGEQGGSGTFTTGATASNVLGLALGREHVLRTAATRTGNAVMSVAEHGIAEAMIAAGVTKIQILSTMPHSSVGKAASIVGIGRANVISIASSSSNQPLAIDMVKLKDELMKPNTANILVISAGEVNTGRFATSSEAEVLTLRKLCDLHGVWIHVDGAFGIFARVLAALQGTDRALYATVLGGTEGLELADSITGDGHKLLNVPYDCGFFFTRHKQLALDVCRNVGATYLTPPVTIGEVVEDGIQSPLNIGIENSRRFRALPVYATLLSYGREGYVDMLVRQVSLTRRVAGWLWDSEDFDVLPQVENRDEMMKRTFMIVLFRAKDEGLNEELVKRINITGRIYVSGTRWEARPAARIAVSNWQVDVERDARVVEEVLKSVVG